MIVHSHYPVGEARAERQALSAVQVGVAAGMIYLVEALSCAAS
jgi:hypothetical protein